MSRVSVEATASASQPLIAFHGYTETVHKILPVDTLFCTLDGLETTVKIVFDEQFSSACIQYNGSPLPSAESCRLADFIQSATSGSVMPRGFRLSCTSNIPHARGLGSSSALFAALAMALCTARGMSDATEVSKLARRGSVSAANSVVGGISLLLSDRTKPWAERVVSPSDFPFKIMCFAVSETRDSMIRHQDAAGSPYYSLFVKASKNAARAAIRAIRAKDYVSLAHAVERQVFLNAAAISTGKSMDPMWRPLTLELYLRLRQMRSETGAVLFFAQSSGPSAYCYVHAESYDRVAEYLRGAGYSWSLAAPGDEAAAVLD